MPNARVRERLAALGTASAGAVETLMGLTGRSLESGPTTFVETVYCAARGGPHMVFYRGMTASFSNPREVVLQLGLHEGMKVGDFGAGSGHYARAAAGSVGSSGKVYAVDVQEEVLKHLKLNTFAHHHGLIDTVWGDIEKLGGSHLRDASLDAVILANTLFLVIDRATLLAEIKRVLKPGGKLLVVDWAGSYGGMGPATTQVVTEHAAEELFINGGFHKVKSFRAGPHHYGIIFTTPSV